MSIKLSTGLRNKMLDTNPLKAILASGFIKLYAGTPPADADAAIGGGNTLLCTISVNSGGTGLTFAASATDGTIVKNASEVWSGLNVATGTATFYRHIGASDTAALSTTEPRIQGTIGLAGTDMVLTNNVLASGATQTIDYYAVNLPATE
jgi:hypothetical protein